MSEKRTQPNLMTDIRPMKPAQSQPALLVNYIKSNLKLIVGAVLIIVIVFLAYGYVHTKNQLQQLSSNPKAPGLNDTQRTINQISELVQLPNNETPTLATVSDASKLKSQPFFAPTQNGDKVLIYTKSGWALIYRPSTNKIIEYSKIVLNSQ